MPDQAELHNKLAGEIVASIIKPILQSGGSWTDVMVVTESVLVGVALAAVKFGRDEQMLDMVVERARKRLAEIRLSTIEVAGRA